MIKLLTPQEVITVLKQNKRVKYRHIGSNKWTSLKDDHDINILLDPDVEFTLDQCFITLGNMKHPEPYVGDMEKGQAYFVADLSYSKELRAHLWLDFPSDRFYMDNGILHLTKENAALHTQALLEYCKCSINSSNHINEI